MSFPKKLFIGIVTLISVVIIVGSMKKMKRKDAVIIAKPNTKQEIVLEIKEDEKKEIALETKSDAAPLQIEEIPLVDEIDSLFQIAATKHPLVETITYTSRVPWLSGRPAWIADYASHFQTSRHFIARSLNKKVDYYTQKVAPGDKFNVLKKDISFHLLIDLSRSKMWFYGLDLETNKRFLLKIYNVGLGRKEQKKPSGCLTPKGKFLLGSKVAIYRPGTMGYFKDQQIEMIRVFGTRWLPFEKELEDCTDGAKGYGLHGAPWFNDLDTNALVEDREKIGQYDSDGCIRLHSEDIEEIFSIVISKPTVVEIVTDYKEADLPGIEK